MDIDAIKQKYTYEQLVEKFLTSKSHLQQIPRMGHKAGCKSVDLGRCTCGADDMFNNPLESALKSLEL